jgi:hypothetical protein
MVGRLIVTLVSQVFSNLFAIRLFGVPLIFVILLVQLRRPLIHAVIRRTGSVR